MAQYRNDPYWLQAKFNGVCGNCDGKIKTGDRAFYYPIGKRIFCNAEDCGQRISREFESASTDESGYASA
jgi:hypothetical protein